MVRKQETSLIDLRIKIRTEKDKDFVKKHNENYLFLLIKNKFNRISPFFYFLDKNKIITTRSMRKINSIGFDRIKRIYLWGNGKNTVNSLLNHNIPIFRIEDGFIRSASLGSDLARPYSLVIDSRGIYFDPTQESDLENILNTYDFDDGIKFRAESITELILKSKLSKYNHQKHANFYIEKGACDKVILVPGQVEDDASIILGGYGMTNEKLIIQVREKNPDSYIIFKAHPDVVAGNRKGSVKNEILKQNCNMVIHHHSIDSCLAIADEVHTITSLCGFDAILRDKRVVTYGMPFYAGWGLTEDQLKCERRTRKLSKYELIAGSLLLYPKYIDPKTNSPCDIETVLKRIIEEQLKYSSSSLYRFIKNLRTFIIRRLKLNYRKSRVV